VDANEFLRRRKDRAAAIILSAVEKELSGPLDGAPRGRLRKVILDQLNDLYNATLDVVQSVDTGTVVLNDIWLERLEAIYDVVTSGNGSHRDVSA
jgi:hypothetical protein